ncbi:hypothetical protein GCM10022377_12140 [Zhihengliuella alba]|uniref:Molybdate ABC transporter substrate-binding protein n=2 Tax=Zhihengliuella alba TaxID=547018 RepID=A0ABP7D434_9MICC
MWFAPSSFTDVAGPLAEAYEGAARAAGDPVDVTVNLGSSAQLVQQVNSGAAPDVLVTADEQAPGALESPEEFERIGTAAANGLVLVVGRDTPLAAEAGGAGPAGPPSQELLDWLAGARVAVCAPEVPCGRAAHAWLAGRPGGIVQDATQEANVRAVLAKVSSGQADAGFVYTTDAAAAGDAVAALPLDAPRNRYPVLVPVGPDHDGGDAGEDFARWLLAEDAQALLGEASFEPGGQAGSGTGSDDDGGDAGVDG